MFLRTQSPTPSSGSLEPDLLKLAGVVLLGAVAAQLDSTIVSVAIHTLGHDLHSSVSQIQWVSTGYLLALATVLPVSGWAFDRFGARRVWMTALSVFLLGSVLCGLAWSTDSLIAFRVLQGLGGGMLAPVMQSILARAAGPDRLVRLMGVIAVPATLAPVLGPVLGGVIVANASWRWIFFVNVPVCGLALWLAARRLPASDPTPSRRLDVLGLSLLSPATAAIVFACAHASDRGGFGDPAVIVALAVGVGMLALFAVHALRTSHEPLIDLRMFRARAFTGSSLMMLLFGGSLFGSMFLLPLYEQSARGQSALDAGLLLAPQGLGMMIALGRVAGLSERLGARTVVISGLVLACVGTLPCAFVGSGISQIVLGAGLVVRGIGMGAALVPVLSAAYHGLSRSEIPRATAAVRTFQQLGGSLGTAVLAVILQHQLTVHPASPATGFGHTFVWTLALTALATLPAALLPGRGAALKDARDTRDAGHAPAATTVTSASASRPAASTRA